MESLISDTLVQRLFDAEQNDYCYGLLPITRSFVYGQVRREPQLEERIRKSLRDWYEARDIKDDSERLVVRAMRQGKAVPESALLDLALAAERRQDFDSARQLHEQALARNPLSWRAARMCAEFCRHRLKNHAEALRLYERAATNAPARGPERGLIFREWGMLLRDSGDPRATDLAMEEFEETLREMPDDVVAVHALANMLVRKGVYRKAITLLEPLTDHRNPPTRKKTLPLLLDAYERTGEILKAAEIRQRLASGEEV